MRRAPAEQIPDGPLVAILSVKLSDGSFESSVKVPLTAPQEERDRAVMRWLEIMQFGLKLPGETHIAADLTEKADA